jgi:CubicO group peptidase (beta-lactamase class C family)
VNSLANQVQRALSEGRVPGCSIAVVDRGGLVWSGAFGFADLAERRTADPRTVYHLFSGTKLFTATAIVQLAERGRLSLDDPLARFLPEIEVGSDIRLTHLLSHSSGLRDSLRSFLAVTFPPDPVPRSAEALARYPIRREAAPGAKVAYRNVNYALLGEVVTRASGVEYTDYVAQEILRPLGMRADFALSPAQRDHVATGYIDRWDPMRLVLWALFPETRGRLYGKAVGSAVALRTFDLATPAIGGLLGSVEDFALFLRAQLDQGGVVLRPDSTRRMQTMAAGGAAGIESRVGVGLGWKLGRVGERAFLNHEGGGAGFTTELRLHPDAGIGIALAMNTMRMPTTMRLAHRVCEMIYAARA